MLKIILPTINIKIERWKYNEEYQIYISSLGRVRNSNRKLQKILLNTSGYSVVETSKGLKALHRLVLETFAPVPNSNELTVDHINQNKRCNEVSNLEWVTQEENNRRALKNIVQIEKSKRLTEDCQIKAGSMTFKNLTAASNYLMSNLPEEERIKTSSYRVEKRIRSAIVNNKKYCGKKWSIV